MVDRQLMGQLIAGDFSKLIMRVKSQMRCELGELLVAQEGNLRYLLQVVDLLYASQLSQQNVEMIAGLRLEGEGDFSVLDAQLRNYQLAYLKPVLTVEEKEGKLVALSAKRLPPFLANVYALREDDLRFIRVPENPLPLGKLRSGSRQEALTLSLPGRDVFSHHVLIPASTGKGKSNLMSTILWNCLDAPYVGMLVLDPHDEYYGRASLGLKNHSSSQEKVVYYSPSTARVPGARTLKVHLSSLRPEYFQGAIALSDPQRQLMFLYFQRFKEDWVQAILTERRIEGVRFHEDTVAVVKRKLIALLGIEMHGKTLRCEGIFDLQAGQSTLTDICKELEQAHTVIIDTSYFSGALEIMIGSMVATQMLRKYKYYKRQGVLSTKPVVSIVVEEAPRVLGKKVLEQGTNIFDTLAREGRKFQVGLVAITQLPSEIPKTVLANMNTKIILGLEMGSERQAVIESAAQDLSADSRSIASLDKGEAIVTSTFSRFALPLKIPFFPTMVESLKKKEPTLSQMAFPGMRLQ